MNKSCQLLEAALEEALSEARKTIEEQKYLMELSANFGKEMLAKQETWEAANGNLFQQLSEAQKELTKQHDYYENLLRAEKEIWARNAKIHGDTLQQISQLTSARDLLKRQIEEAEHALLKRAAEVDQLERNLLLQRAMLTANGYHALERQVAQQAATISTLVSAFKYYGSHEDECAWRQSDYRQCSCGFLNAVKNADAALANPPTGEPK